MNARAYPACLPLLILAFAAVVVSCHGPAEEDASPTLTEDERYIVLLYMKITEIEMNLQDNPEEQGKKWDELRTEFDPARIRAALDGLEKDPARWVAVYERISELTQRRRDRRREIEVGS